MSSKDDHARAPEWPVYHWDKVEYSDDHGLIARSGTSKKNPKIDDAKPVKQKGALEKLKKDKEAMMRRIIYDGERSSTKAFRLDSGLEVVLPSKKGGKKGKKKTRKKRRRKRRQSRRKSKGRKRRRKKRTKRRK